MSNDKQQLLTRGQIECIGTHRASREYASMHGRYLIETNRPIVQVRDTTTGMLVAYSCLRSSFDDSLEEFVVCYAR